MAGEAFASFYCCTNYSLPGKDLAKINHAMISTRLVMVRVSLKRTCRCSWWRMNRQIPSPETCFSKVILILYWLPVGFWAQFKVLVKTIYSVVPGYIKEHFTKIDSAYLVQPSSEILLNFHPLYHEIKVVLIRRKIRLLLWNMFSSEIHIIFFQHFGSYLKLVFQKDKTSIKYQSSFPSVYFCF